jgi:hypothetical protein
MIQRARGARRIAFVSSYSPRKCGIATFASDLISNVRLAGAGEPLRTAIYMERGRVRRILKWRISGRLPEAVLFMFSAVGV